MDMAGFAVNLQLFLRHPSASFSLMAGIGMQESHFLSHLVRVEDLEPKARNCTEVRRHRLFNKVFYMHYFLFELDFSLAHQY